MDEIHDLHLLNTLDCLEGDLRDEMEELEERLEHKIRAAVDPDHNFKEAFRRM